MHIITWVFIVLGLVAAGFFGLIFLVIMLSSKPTRGRKIDDYTNSKKALLVVDIQEDFTGIAARSPFPFKGSDTLISTVNRLLDAASGNDLLVAYIGHELPDNFISRALTGSRSIKGQPGARMDSRLHIVNSNYFSKCISDSFSSWKLNDFLENNHVNEVYIVGLDGEKCVYKTALGALNRGYKVTIIKDAIVYMSQKDLSEVTKMYENDGISVIFSSELLNCTAIT
ncbi:MAG: isochorismatase family cysteine hydrolase [Bacillota bacterium]